MKRFIGGFLVLVALLVSIFVFSSPHHKDYGQIDIFPNKLPYIIGGYDWVTTNKIFYVQKSRSRYLPTVHDVFTGEKQTLDDAAAETIPASGIFRWTLVSNRTAVITETIAQEGSESAYYLNLANRRVSKLKQSPPGDFFSKGNDTICAVERQSKRYVVRTLNSDDVFEIPVTGSVLGFDKQGNLVTARIEDDVNNLALILDSVPLDGGSVRSTKLSFPTTEDFSDVTLADDGNAVLFKTVPTRTIFRSQKSSVWRADLQSGHASLICRGDQLAKAYWFREYDRLRGCIESGHFGVIK